MSTTLTLLDKLPALRRQKSPMLSFCIGFIFGSIGLGLYFRSFIDFLAPLAIVLVMTLAGYAVADPSAAWLLGAFLAGLYGAFRAANSNERIAMRARTA